MEDINDSMAFEVVERRSTSILMISLRGKSTTGQAVKKLTVVLKLKPKTLNMQCSQEHLKTMVYAKCGRQTKCIMGNAKIEN